MTTSIPSRRAMRIATGVASVLQGRFSSGTSSRRPNSRRLRADAREPVPSRRGARRRGRRVRPDVADAMDPRLRRQLELGVRRHCAGQVGREHVRLDPERRQVRRELQRPMHATAAARREVERHEENLQDRNGNLAG